MQTAETTVTTIETLKEKIKNKTARVGIVGLGYVGLPLAVEFANAGFTVTGIDVQESKVDGLNRGESHVQDVPSAEIAKYVNGKKFRATTDFSVVRELDTINICVPTPLRKTKDPDMSFIVSAVEEVAKHFHPGLLIILESTTYPGTTDELLLPTFEKLGYKVGHDFFLCFSPERVDPGNPTYQTHNTPEGCRRRYAGLHADGRAVLLTGAGTRCARRQHPRRRDGEAAGEYLPHDQHRPGQ